MVGKQIKQFAVLHFVFIVIIVFYYLNREELFLNETSLENSPQIYREETSEGMFSKEQIEEILIDILIPLQETPFQEDINQDENNNDAEKNYRQKILEDASSDPRIQSILESKRFTTPEAKKFFHE